MNWYEALGYVTPSGTDPATPTVNTTRTGCNAYSERSDKKDLGTWRVPTSLELTQLWVMGAGVGGTTPCKSELYICSKWKRIECNDLNTEISPYE